MSDQTPTPGPRPTKVHFVKSVQPHFDGVWSGLKSFEIRKDDRDFQTDDVLVQREFDGRFYKHRSTIHRIGYVLRDFVGLRRGYCAFALLDPDDAALDLAEASERET